MTLRGASLRVPGCTCGPEPVQHDGCFLCQRARRAAAYKRLTSTQRMYDDFVDPLNAYHQNFPPECSCHINPPCSYCTRDIGESKALEKP